jgi:hypothetical protein
MRGYMATAARTPTKRRSRPKARQEERENPSALETEEVIVEIEDLANFNESINIGIHGPSGHGKTVLAGGAPAGPSGRPPTYLTTEKGVVAAQRAGLEAKLIRAPSWEHVVAGKRKLDETLDAGDWAIVDSGTKMQVLMLRWILQEINKDNPSRDLDIPAIQDHQKWQNYYKRFVDSLIDAPYNVIFVFTTMLREDEEGEDQVLPAITGKGQEICDYVCAQMDVNLYYALSDKTPDGNLIRRALAQPVSPYVRCKDRYNVLGRYIDIPDGYYGAMADIINAIQTGEPLVYEDDQDEEEEYDEGDE